MSVTQRKNVELLLPSQGGVGWSVVEGGLEKYLVLNTSIENKLAKA